MSESTIISSECPYYGDNVENRNKMRLFAAAPDLLAACEAWARIMTVAYIPTSELLLNGLTLDAVQQAEELTRLAIKKARGET